MGAGTVFPSSEPLRESGQWAAYNNGTVVAWGSAQTYLSDASDLTWVQATAVPSGSRAKISGDLGNVTAGGSVITQIRAVARLQSTGNFTFNVLSGGTQIAQVQTEASGGSMKAYIGGWYPASTATGWATAVLNAATMAFNTDNAALRVGQLRMEFDMVSTPVVGTVVASPTNTDRPTISWTYTDADADAQSSAVVKVFSSAQYSAGGFDPDTSTATYSTVVNGAGTTVVPDTAIGVSGFVFRGYVQAISNKSTVPVASAWTNSVATTLSFTAPTSPTLTLSWDNTNKRTSITVAGSASPFRYTVTRADGTVIGTALSTMPASGTATLFDYTPARGTGVVYSATITTAATAALQLTSTARLGTVTTLVATDWELRALDAPTTAVTLSAPVAGLTWNQYEGVTVLRPLGSVYPVVVAGDLNGDDGQISFVTKTQAQWETLKTILEVQGNLLLVSPFLAGNGQSEKWVIRLTSRDWQSEGVIGTPVKRVTANFVETGA